MNKIFIKKNINHLWKDFAFLRDKLNDVYSLVGKRREIIGERVSLDRKQDLLLT